jgi:hypothetical protein
VTHFGLKFLLNKDSCQTNIVLLCPILELKVIGLNSVDVVLVNVELTETEQVETRTANFFVSIVLLY